MRLIILLTAVVTLNCFGQDLTSEHHKESTSLENSQKTLYDNWLIYATNNSYIKGLIQQKYVVDSEIHVLQNQRQQFIAQDQYNTYTNTPYLIIDDSGHSRAYASRAAYDDEMIGGLIKTSLNISKEIIKQKELFFASYGSNATVFPSAKLSPPSGLKVTSE